ncbi:MAG TPA: aminoacyl--tRNA ligase-related protein, partial [Patescibacteria group bacterium]
YTYLPFGLRVLRKIEQVIREEMNSIGGEEILMPMLHPAEIWKTSGGWDHIDVLFKLKSRTGKDYALGQSQEEVVTPLMKEFIRSYRDLPKAVYHIQWKFRDELRAKSGILRGREFFMKDMYSFHENQEDFERFYEIAKKAYLNIFSRLGLTSKVTEASGGGFSEKISYEFEVLTDAGEANILYCDTCEFCVNVDDISKYKEGDRCPKCGNSDLRSATASEVGNVFDLGRKYTKAFDLSYADQKGEKQYPIMGCYGIGISRTMGVIVEKFHDDRGIIWPENVAPFTVSLISFDDTKDQAQKLYDDLKAKGIEVLWDDRDASAGVKFGDADLIGNPYRVVISKRSLESGGLEVKRRSEKDSTIMPVNKLVEFLSK